MAQGRGLIARGDRSLQVQATVQGNLSQQTLGHEGKSALHFTSLSAPSGSMPSPSYVMARAGTCVHHYHWVSFVLHQYMPCNACVDESISRVESEESESGNTPNKTLG